MLCTHFAPKKNKNIETKVHVFQAFSSRKFPLVLLSVGSVVYFPQQLLFFYHWQMSNVCVYFWRSRIAINCPTCISELAIDRVTVRAKSHAVCYVRTICCSFQNLRFPSLLIFFNSPFSNLWVLCHDFHFFSFSFLLYWPSSYAMIFWRYAAALYGFSEDISNACKVSQWCHLLATMTSPSSFQVQLLGPMETYPAM